MQIRSIVLRTRVDDLDEAIAFYERLTDRPARRFAYSDAELAAVGPFLLFRAAGTTGNRLGNVAATISVDDIELCAQRLVELGANLVAAPAATPNGHRLISRHPDGAVYEYVGP
jgi:predicted enzyme related to lactoylglutathione lyase